MVLALKRNLLSYYKFLTKNLTSFPYYLLGSTLRFGGPQCPFSRSRSRQSGRFRNGQTNEGL
jgi:hypothetical protein